MSLRLITGRAGVGKSELIRDEVAQASMNNPLGAPIFFVVPDQMSFSTESALSTTGQVNGIIRTQVTTFKRLAWRVLQETGGISRQEISGFGYRMLIRRLLEEHKEELSLFKQAANKRGFTDQMEMLLKEFTRYCLDYDTLHSLEESLKQMDAPRTLQDKTHDLSVLLRALEERLGTAYIDSEGYYALLSKQIRDSVIIAESDIYVDGFVTMTSREYEILGELMKHAKRVTIALPLDDEIQDLMDDQSLFHGAAKTAERLKEMARESSVSIELSVHLSENKRFKNNEIKHIEANLHSYPAPAIDDHEHVHVIEADSRRAEIHAVARHIRRLVRDEQMRYQDIAVLYRQAEVYDELIETTFAQYDIPVFINRKKAMLHHPLIEFSRSAFEAVLSDYQYEPMFRAIKTDLFFPLQSNIQIWRERADRLENFVISQGIYGERWTDERRWFVKKYRGLEFHSKAQTDEERAIQADITAVRDFVLNPLEEFAKKIKVSETGKSVAQALFELMESLQVYEKLQVLKDHENEQGHLLLATEHDQAWSQWIDVLDQFVLMFGDENLTPKESLRLLEEGFDTLEFSRIPPSLDQVTVATVDLSRLSNIRSAFVVGVNDGVFPKRLEQEGLLSDTEREWFMQIGFELAPTSKMRLMDESYMAYRAVTTASEKLFVSYAVADEEGKALLPSTYIKRLQQLLPNIEVEVAVIDPAVLKESTIDYIQHPRTTLPFMATKLKQSTVEGNLEEEWLAVASYYKNDPFWQSIFERVIKPIAKPIKAQRLDRDTTNALYGDSFTSSVSRVEKYYSCPFAHFVTYGLRLEERGQYLLEAPAIGDLFHASLKWIADETQRLGLTWAQLSTTQAWNLARQAVDAISPHFVHQILLSSRRYQYIQRKLVQILQRTMTTLRDHASVSTFVPIAIEAGFGPGEELPTLEIPLKNGHMMKMRGRIDRVDAAVIEGQQFVRIVDYKSSAKGLDLNDVYYGISLQMLTYLDVAVSNSMIWLGQQADPAGVLYVHVHNPMLKLAKELSDMDLAEEVFKKYKMRGLLVDDAHVLNEMDTEISGTSKVIPARINKDGSISKAFSKVVSAEDLANLRTFVRTKHQQAGDGMLSGDTRVLPYRMKDKTACDYCNFRSVCQFDPTDVDQQYRKLAIATPEEITQRIKEEVTPHVDTH
ncbi:helicase-exonuclease AddAB subunit AddB [Paenisporosarcina antarctica]|uniref:ATP-dependent helicase/deoxyribonuclease subunit B n=1 Tax=Paenisporosarcina antarctica TaxID=417367 RepID=A0A4P6ZYW5_9BACL|nr:helicase-exonuclease AddAB subunit AddB [Paenisporosarcina antarctica]QBP41731.1 helicase-exonuclease AddAB subunit AddB [Paenisporosarcina antarctica]